MAPTLSDMPNELLIQICKDVDETDAAALWSLAQTSKHMYAIAKTRLFHTITFHLTTAGLLARHVHECERFLQRNGSFRYVRRVVVTGCLQGRRTRHPRDIDFDFDRWQLHPPTPIDWERNFSTLYRLQSLGIQDDAQEIGKHFSEAERHLEHPWMVPGAGDWQPLANILGRFPALKDLEFNCVNTLPMVILDSLRGMDLVPRLHISERFRHGFDSSTSLVIPPCLFRLCIPASVYRHHLSSAVPTLANRPLEENEGRKRIQDLLPTQITRLEILGDSLRYGSIAPAFQALALDKHSQSLRVLRTSQPVDRQAVEALLDTSLPALSHLTFTCSASGGDGYLETVKRLFNKLPSLSSLELKAWNHELEPLNSLPANLHTLLLTEISGHRYYASMPGQKQALISKEEIRRISQECPNIQHLALTVQRSRGSAAEVAMYRAIGGFPQLRRLTLTLAGDSSALGGKVYSVTDRPFSLFQPGFFRDALFPNVPKKWVANNSNVMMELMINYALDKELAASIFQTIWLANARFRQADSTPSSPLSCPAPASASLERMLVRTRGYTNSATCFPGYATKMTDALVRLRYELCRAYLVKTDGVDGSSGGLVTAELPTNARARTPWRSDQKQAWLMSWFRMLWPNQKGGGAGWSSFPLELDHAEVMKQDVPKLKIKVVSDFN